jgi:hypothetical protein
LPNVVVDKDAKYANEVFNEVNLPEGYRFVNNSDQAKRDKLKNSILDKAGIPLLRLSTDGSNEKNKIINALSR